MKLWLVWRPSDDFSSPLIVRRFTIESKYEFDIFRGHL